MKFYKISNYLKSKGIDTNPEKLDSIVGPEEFKSLDGRRSNIQAELDTLGVTYEE